MAATSTTSSTAVASYLKSSYGFGAEASLFRSLALGLCLIQELVRSYSPILFRGLSFLLRLLPIPIFFTEGDDASLLNRRNGNNGPNSLGERRKEVVEAIVPEQYKTFTDDRKASLGNENDVYMLKAHGFNKYRHVSKSFRKRNNMGDDGSEKREK